MPFYRLRANGEYGPFSEPRCRIGVRNLERGRPNWADLASLWTEDSQPPQTLRPDRNRDSGSIEEKPPHIGLTRYEREVTQCPKQRASTR